MKLISLPNLLTLLNLCCGIFSSIFLVSSNGNISTKTITIVLILMIISLIADFLDGMVARLMKTGSSIGKELDSLADCISFGVVPGLMLFVVFNNLSSNFLYKDDNIKIASISLFSFLIPTFSALRLAKFNLDEEQSTYFKGLATPSNTLFIFSIFSIYFTQGKIVSKIADPYLLILISIVFSILLIINLPLFALKFKGLSWKENSYKYVFLIITLVLIIFLQIKAIPLIILLYIFISIIFRKEIVK